MVAATEIAASPARVETTSLLLNGLRTFANQTIWSNFDARYRRIIQGFSRRMGLSEDDAGEVAQQTLADFASGYREGRYQRDRGRLSSWIYGIARHRIIDLQRRSGRRCAVAGSSVVAEIPTPQEATRVWDDEREQSIFDQAMQELRDGSRTHDHTVEAFERVAIQGEAPAEVAVRFSLSVDQVYRIKNRVTERLRRIVTRLQQEQA